MTTKELNRDIKRLEKEIFKMSQNCEKTGNNDEYFFYIANDAKKEFTRLFHADATFEYMNRESVLIMLRLNLRHRFIQLHQFGSAINLPSEL